jgi:hypothetical protein
MLCLGEAISDSSFDPRFFKASPLDRMDLKKISQ